MIRKIFITFGLLLLCQGYAAAGLFDAVTRHLDTVTTTARATQKAARPISDEEEYYVGRAVAARILATYPLLKNSALTEYLNSMGRTLALHSDQPYTYGGYHIAVLDTDEANAFACPGGIIFITKGMIRTAANEDELAAVLAHEIAHVNHRDGISSIKKSRWTEAVTVIGSKAAQKYGSRDLAQLVNIFEGSIDDVVKTLVLNGYSKSDEYNADKSSLTFLARAGYNPAALRDFLDRLVRQGSSSDSGILKTHPGTSDRIDNIKDEIPASTADPYFISRRSDRFLTLTR